MSDREYIIHTRVLSFYAIVRLINRLKIINIDAKLDHISLHELAKAALEVRGSTMQDQDLYKRIEQLIYKEIK